MEGKSTLTRAEKVRAMGDKLDGYARELAEQMQQGKSDMLIRYLEFAASFHHYSFGNLMLILGQCPTASRVAGLRQWNRLGRRVRAGEHGIMIFAPMAVWKRGDMNTEAASEDEMAESERNETRSKITIFKPVYVFDVSMTDGEPLPQLVAATGEAAHYLPALRGAVAKMGITLEERETVARSASTKGASYGGRIVLKKGLSDAETMSVLIHETGHELLHWDGERKGKKVEETEADMTAYIVCRHFGIECNTSDYLLLHKSTPELLMERLETVRSVAARIIDAVEDELHAEMHAEAV